MFLSVPPTNWLCSIWGKFINFLANNVYNYNTETSSLLPFASTKILIEVCVLVISVLIMNVPVSGALERFELVLKLSSISQERK